MSRTLMLPRSDQIVVQISDTARNAILAEARRKPYLETGGALAATDFSPNPLRIDFAGGHTPSMRHRRHSLTLHRSELEDSCGDYRLLGEWHSHPDGDARFSRSDFDGWVRMRTSTRRPIREYVAIIATPDSRAATTPAGWKHPDLTAWVIGDGYFQRAQIVTVRTTPPTVKSAPTARKAKSRKASDMLVATRTFTTTYHGETITVTAGLDRVERNHPLVLSNPDAFRAAA